jgi:hypothetical protein
VDLDASAYNDVNDPNYRWATPHYPFKVAGGMPVHDSGALIVGASTSGADWGTGYMDNTSFTYEVFPEGIPRNYSNHGARVDFRAWGEAVVTTGTIGGNNINGENVADEEYTYSYSGTSSASPMIAGAAAAIQGVRAAALNDWATGERLSPLRIRNLLRVTGTTFSMNNFSPAEFENVVSSPFLNADATLGPRPNILRAAQGIGRHPDEYCYLSVPVPRFALEDSDGDGLVLLDESDLHVTTGNPNKYFSFRPVMPNVPPSASYIAWSSDGSEPACLYPAASTCTSPASAQNNQHVYTYAQDSNDYAGFGVSVESDSSATLTLPITVKAKTTVVTSSCGVRTSDTVEITYALN